MWNKLTRWLLLIGIFMLGISLTRSYFSLSQRGDILTQSEQSLKDAKETNESLIRKQAQVESNEFIEKEARNRLNLGMEGEIVILLPSISPIVEITPSPTPLMPNWRKWVKTFF